MYMSAESKAKPRMSVNNEISYDYCYVTGFYSMTIHLCGVIAFVTVAYKHVLLQTGARLGLHILLCNTHLALF